MLVRFVVKDDEQQAKTIYRIFKQAESDKEVFFVPLLVPIIKKQNQKREM